uniref:Cytochrome c oxidase subunit 2 n=2 Tax=Argopecten purpuratus TaxID=228297 RepID=A0A0K2CPM3_ARGPU|nr:cytochrome c oxidase subunit II [Argopecten purpuratus]ALA07939.1 cytochrome c oxidase subunit II [Argopecten purpuratus]
MLEWSQVSLPEPASVQAFNLQIVYEGCLVVAFFISFVVLFFMRMVVFNTATCSVYLECGRLEVFWSVLPFMMLVCICSISVFALYVNDETNEDPLVDVVVVGHQWYWSYQVGVDGGPEVFKWDSRIVSRSVDSPMDFQDYWTVDRPLPVPVGGVTRVLVTSEDVLHSWGAPRLHLKVDAIPGRLTRGLFELKLPGVIKGMCVELCGAYHSMMPTIIEGLGEADFWQWASRPS